MTEYWVIALLVIVAAVVVFVVVSRSRKQGGAAQSTETAANSAQLAQELLAAVGGSENVAGVDHCTTRLRFEVKSYAQVNEAAVKAAGAAGVVRPSKNVCQVTVGSAQPVYDALKKLL